ncbi:tape measure protein [Lactiplantibacillus argentoratensis]|uniref:Tape measure protein n=1 Tax=Lactiplantibacillus argentoratensis TaxID=271881 RepID=A0ABS5UGR7_9LACO|nr:tape measure protein [Lactiplantibacillus argentoratensis]MBT1140569.1 tape measure protein [Lactiplantibacillus argentoratensis]
MSTVSATIKILNGFTGPLNQLNSGLQQSQNRFNQFKSAMNGNMTGGLNKSVNQTSGMFKSMLGANIIGGGISKGMGMATAGIGSMIGELNESSTAWQTFNGNMNMLGKSPAQIAKTRGGLQKFAQQTIYSASDMASTYSQLAAVGTKNTDQLVKGFGGLAAASSDPQQAMKTLSQQATQAAAKPQIQWADFKLMLEQTPAGMAMVAKTMHRSTGQLVKDVQAGKVKTDDFFNAIAKTGTNKNFSKMATQYKTVGQAMDGLKETLANNLQPAFDKVGKVGIKAISSLTDSIGNVNFDGVANKITPMVTGVINGLKVAGQAIGAFFKSFSNSGAITAIGQAFSSIKNTIGTVVSSLSSMGSKDPFAAFKSLGSITGGAISGAANAIKALSDVIGDLDPSSLKLLGAAFVVLKAGTKGLVLTAIVAGLNLLNKLSPGQLNALAKAVGAFAIGLTTLKALGKIDAVFSGLGKSIKGLGSGGALASAGESAKTGAVGFIKLGASLALVGGAILMAGAGMWLLANATTQLVAAGWPAIAVFAGMLVGIAALAAVVALIGPAMLVGAVGFLVFGAALLLIGVAVFVAAAGLELLATQLPLISQYGVSAAIGLLALAGAVAVFGLAAIVAAVGLVLLGASLLVLGVGFVIAAVGALLFAVSMAAVVVTVIVAAVGMLMLAVTLPLIAVFSMIAAVGLLLMSVALVVIAVTGLIAGIGMMVLALSMVLLAPLSMVAAIGLLLLGVAMTLVMVTVMVAAVGMMILAVAMPLIAVFAMVAAVGLLLMSVALILIAATAIVAGAGMIVLGVGLALVAPLTIVAAVGVLLLGAAAIVLGAGLMIVAAGLLVVAAGMIAVGVAAMMMVAAFIVAGSMMVGAITGSMRNVVSAVRSGISSAVSVAKGFGSDLVSVGRDLIQGLVNGINSMIGTAVSAVKSLGSKVVNGAKSVLHIGSPSKLFKQYGRWVDQGLINGLNHDAGSAANASANMAQGVVNAANGMTATMPDLMAGSLMGSNPGEMLADGYSRALSTINDVVSAIGSIGSNVIGVNGRVQSSLVGSNMATASDVPTTTSFGNNVSGTVTDNHYSDDNTSSMVVQVQPGAIQVVSSGDGAMDGESIARELENYLIRKNGMAMS